MMDHLNEEQIAELVAASPRRIGQDQVYEPDLERMEAHLAECAHCAAEVASLRESLAFFREATNSYAEARLDRIPAFHTPQHRSLLRQPLYWASAAAALLLAVFIPVETSLHTTTETPAPAAPIARHAPVAAESDEALLEDVSRELSESVPTAMEALADPTGTLVSGAPNATQRTN
jgi:anti-sigma factor RsiW